jgi:hypothetical protein
MLARLARLILDLFNDKLFFLLSFYFLHFKGKGKIYFTNINNPRTFNEKTLWMKLYYRKTPIDYFADKFKVREYVSQKIGDEYLVPLIKSYKNADEIDFNTLPEKFVLKVSHGSGWNIIVLKKKEINKIEVRRKLDGWLKKDYYNIGREWQYKNITPMIICEKLLINKDGTPITDYKVFCFNGSARFVQIDLDRFTNHRRQFYDTDWKLQPFTTLFPHESRAVEKPKHLPEILQLAEKLAQGFIFVRVDLYYNGNSIYFSELTLHHGGGCEPFIPSNYDLILGNMLRLTNDSH